MTSPTRLHALAAFLPGSLIRALLEDPSRPREGARVVRHSAVLFVDITGFTTMAEALDNSGPSGAERLRGILDTCFSQLLDTLGAHGGDALRFPGDALVALWPAASAEELPRAVRLAARCAQAFQAVIKELEPVNGVQLRLKVGIGAGPVQLSDVGGEAGRWDFLASGEPLVEMAHAEHAALPGDVILGPQAWRHLDGVAVGEPRGEAGWKLVALEPTPLPEVHPPELRPELEPALRAYLPQAVLHRLEAGHGRWLSEFRTATLLFINLGTPDFAAGQRPEELQRALRTIQATLFRYEGSANQVVVDDKGVVVVAAFGLPPLSHEDDPARAVQTALEVRTALRALGVTFRIGLATGRVFCGTSGVATRREYVTVSHTVNLAARLMQAAAEDIFCDANTLRLASSKLRFETLAPLKMKGMTQPVPVYRPEPVAEGAGATSRGTRVVGRQDERGKLTALVRRFAERGVGGAVLLKGEAGIGKSVLVEELRERAEATKLSTATGAGSTLERSTSYHAWRPVLARLLGPDTRLLERLRSHPEREAWAPLLNGLLSVKVPDNEVVRQMSGPERDANTRELLVQLLDEATRERPRVVVLEDAQWMDTASWELALDAQRRVKRLLLVIATRPLAEPARAVFHQLRDFPGTVFFLLERLPHEEVLALVRQRLGVRGLPSQVATLIRDQAEGHPFFAEELACAMRDAGYVTVEGGECKLVARSVKRMAIELPGTIQGLLTSRIDHLSSQQQLTLKVASVLGRIFSFELLRTVYPEERDRDSLPEQLAELERMGLVLREDSPTGPVYAFRHALIQEAAYHLMAFSQRRELHRAVARLYEREQKERGAQLQPLVAHHWRLAEETERALDSLEQAAEAAYARGALPETIALINQAQEAANHRAEPVAPLRGARWNAWIGNAYLALGDTEQGLAHCDTALRLLEQPRPATRWAWSVRLAWELARHASRLVVGRWLPAPESPQERERLALTAGLYSALSTQSFYADRPVEQLTASLISVNLAEATRDPAPAALSYGVLGYLSGLGRLQGLARRYFRRASVAEQAAPPPITDILQGAWHMSFGRWEEGLRDVERGVTTARRLNDRFTLCVGLEALGMGLELARDPVAAQDVRESMLRVANDAANVITAMWALTQMAPTLLLLGRHEEAEQRLREASALLPFADALAQPRYHCNAALVARRTGEHARVQSHARDALRLLQRRPLLMWSDLSALTSLAQACLEQWEDARHAGEARATEPRAQALAALRLLRKASRLYPIALGRTARLEGTRAWLEGRPEHASRHWRRALELALRHRMPTDEGLAHRELARHAPEPDTRARHLAEARRVFEHLGATGLLRSLDTSLPSPSGRGTG
jgi:class 3 adenylate cyclase/tetratricopeptide (TPR) repeat protein